MHDLVRKIQELVKTLGGFKVKTDPLVPAIKAPTLKPLSMPTASSVPKKIPGIEPPSNKDPKKVTEQLKNPRPKKPSTEMIKTDKNGQWSIHNI